MLPAKFLSSPYLRSFRFVFAVTVAAGFSPSSGAADINSPTVSIPAGIRGGVDSPIVVNLVTRQGAEHFVLRRRAPLLHGPVYENGVLTSRVWDEAFLYEGVARERGARKGLRPRQIRADVVGNRLRIFFSGRRNGRLFVMKTRGLSKVSVGRVSGVPLTKRIRCPLGHVHSAAVQGARSSPRVPAAAALPATGTVSLFAPPRVVELGIDADFEFFQLNGSASVAEMLASLNAAEAFYTEQIGVSFKVVSSNVSTNPANPSTSKNGLTLLTEYAQYIIGFTGRTADLFHLFTGKEPITFTQNGATFAVIGLAGSPASAGQPGPVCVDPSNSFGFSARVEDSLRGILTAHEIGHNMGATHLDQDFPTQDLPTSIMTSVIEPTGNRFSEYSRGQIATQVIDHGECLGTESKYLTFAAKVTGSRFEATFTPTSAMGSGCGTSIYASKKKSDLEKRLTGATKLNLTAIRKGKKKVLSGTVRNSGKVTRFYVRAVTYCTVGGVKNYQGSPILALKARDSDPIARLKNRLK